MTKTPEEQDAFRWLEADWSDIVHLLRRNRALLLVAPALGLLLGLAASFLLPPVYRTSATIYLRPNFDREMALEQNISKLEDADSLRSMERAMVSDAVVLRAVERLGLRNDPGFLGESVPPEGLPDARIMEILRDRYAAELVPNTRLVELTVEDYSPERAARIADALVDEFLGHLSSDKRAKEAELRSLLLGQAERALEGALAAEEKLKEFRLANPETIVEQDSGIFHERLLEHGKALNEATAELSRLEAVRASLQSIDAAADPYRVFQAVNNRTSDHLSELLTMHAAAKSDFAAVQQRVTASHPSYLEAESRLAQVNETLLSYAGELKNGVELEHAAALERTQRLQENLSALQQELVGFKQASAEFRGLKEEIDRHWNTHSRLQQKIMDLDVGPEGDPTFATVISRALVPDEKAGPKELLWGGGGILLGGLFALGMVWRRHRQGLPFTSAAQPAEILGIPAIAELQAAKSGETGQRIARLESSPQWLNLLLALRDIRVVQVTSLDSGEDAALLPQALCRSDASRGIPSLLLTFRHQADPRAEARPLLGSAQASVMEIHPDLLLQPGRFISLLSERLKEYGRIVIDTTQSPEVEVKLTVCQIAQASLVAVSGGRGRPREEYRRFVDACAARRIFTLGAVYLQPAEKEERPRPQARLALPSSGGRLLPARPVSA